MGKSNLLSTTGFENRTYNLAWRSIDTGVNVPLMVRQLLSGGGELLNPAGGALNSIYFDLGPYSNPHSKSQCWIPTNGSTPSGIVSCQTTRP